MRLASLFTRAVTRWFTYLAPDFPACQPLEKTIREASRFSGFLGQLGKISGGDPARSCCLRKLVRPKNLRRPSTFMHAGETALDRSPILTGND
jgi:hypothetical protein